MRTSMLLSQRRSKLTETDLFEVQSRGIFCGNVIVSNASKIRIVS